MCVSFNTRWNQLEDTADLDSIRVRDALRVNPVLGLRILGVVNLRGRVDRRVEVLKEAASVVALTVEAHVVGVVGAKYTC